MHHEEELSRLVEAARARPKDRLGFGMIYDWLLDHDRPHEAEAFKHLHETHELKWMDGGGPHIGMNTHIGHPALHVGDFRVSPKFGHVSLLRTLDQLQEQDGAEIGGRAVGPAYQTRKKIALRVAGLLKHFGPTPQHRELGEKILSPIPDGTDFMIHAGTRSNNRLPSDYISHNTFSPNGTHFLHFLANRREARYRGDPGRIIV